MMTGPSGVAGSWRHSHGDIYMSIVMSWFTTGGAPLNWVFDVIGAIGAERVKGNRWRRGHRVQKLWGAE